MLPPTNPGYISHLPHKCHLSRPTHLILKVMQVHFLIQFQVPTILLRWGLEVYLESKTRLTQSLSFYDSYITL